MLTEPNYYDHDVPSLYPSGAWERTRVSIARPISDVDRRAAALAAAEWALTQPDPKAALREVLEAMGMLGEATRRCLSCRKDYPYREYVGSSGAPRLKTCQSCRDKWNR